MENPEYENKEVTSNSMQVPQQQQQQQSFAPDFDTWVNSGGSSGGTWWYPKTEQPEIIKLDKNKNLKPENKYRPQTTMHAFGKGKDPVPCTVFYITTSDEPNVQKEWYVSSKRLASQIAGYITDGFSTLKITKHGKETNVSYDVQIIPQNQRELELLQKLK